jgi:hypothetical protein
VLHNDPWWQDVSEFDAQRVEGEVADARALRAAIEIAQGVLEEYWRPGRDAAWKRNRLHDAGLPVRRPARAGDLVVDLR